MNLKVRYDSIAIRCEEYPFVTWNTPTENVFQKREGTHVWLIESKKFEKEYFAHLWDKLSLTEKERALRFHFERDRKRFVLTHGVLRELLGKYFESDEEMFFGENEFGKPFLIQPFFMMKSHLEGGSFEFNITHSSNLILLAFRFLKNHQEEDFQLGVDVEKIQTDFDYDLILDNFFSKKEIHQIKESQDSLNTFYQYWTKKESLVKATGRGLMNKLYQFDLSQKENKWDLDENNFTKFNANKFFIHSFQIENYQASLTLMGGDSPIHFYSFKK